MDDNINANFFKYSEENRLDLEFRQILCVIKQFIPYVNSNSNLNAYRCWLEKLSSDHSNKSNRNRYLIELAKQIQDNIIAYPFDQNPTLEPLKPYPEFECAQESTTQKDRVQINVFPEKFGENFNFSSDTTPVYISHGSPINYLKTVDSCNNLFSPYQKIVENSDNVFRSINDETDYGFKYNHESFKKFEEDSSWLDLTTYTSLTSIHNNFNGAGDAEDKSKKCMLEEKQNRDFNIETNKNYIPVNWKETIETIELRLNETLSQKDHLKCMLNETLSQKDELQRTLETKNCALAHEIKAKEQLEEEAKKNSEIYEKEIKALKTAHEKAIEKLENSYQVEKSEIHSNYHLKMQEIKTSCGMQLVQMKLHNDNDKNAKDKEIFRLSDIIQQQCTKMSNEIISLRKHVETSIVNNRFEDKVLILQKCVSKMDKLYHKSEKDYLQQIEKLKQEIVLKDKVQLIQIKTLRVELALQSSIERQKQFEEVINNLEVKYIKMLEHHEKQASETKVLDDERIQYLRDLLERHNIPFKVF